jgi:hypothetical protein
MRHALLALGLFLAAARPAAALILEGKVLETAEDGTYTFALIDTFVGEKWAAIPRTTVAKGAALKVYVSASPRPYDSKALKRSFAKVFFGSLESPHAAVPVPERAPIKVEKAAGPDARTIAGIYAERAALKGRKVLVRAKVVKFTPKVIDRNWVHLRDGSGDAKAGDHDLAATTQEKLEVGAVVTLRGTIALDKDMGAGYKFPVLLEDAAKAP